jgi:anti-sigma-K factor RskA
MNIHEQPFRTPNVDQLAASYALGTLRGGARRRFEALARDNATLRAAALVWQSRLSVRAELQPQEAPSPAVWKRIENLVGPTRRPRHAGRTGGCAGGGGWWASLGLWRGASAAGRLAAAAAVVVGLNVNAA